MNILEYIQGFIIGLSLIIAIGPQNLFVIRQGLKKSFVFIWSNSQIKILPKRLSKDRAADWASFFLLQLATIIKIVMIKNFITKL